MQEGRHVDSAERAQAVRGGNVRVAARLISDIENGAGAERAVLAELHRSCGRAHLVGVTGPPGAGKSTLVAALIQAYRTRGATVGVLAVDPSSPFTGGALLGDRDRMVASALDSGVFIRSVASRGVSGGLAAAVNDAVDVMDAMGKDVVIIETVGVGQGELAIAEIAHTVVLVLVPGYGDTLQAMKAGILEVADVIAVNKSDLPNADQVVRELDGQGLERTCAGSARRWAVPIVPVSARRGDGIEKLIDEIGAHRAFAEANGWTGVRERSRRRQRLYDLVRRRIEDEIMAGVVGTAAFARWSGRLDAGEVDPATAANAVVGELRDRLLAAADDDLPGTPGAGTSAARRGADPPPEADDPHTTPR